MAVPSPSPFHGPAAPPPGRRILLLSYCFPPNPVVGSLRWQRFSGYFAEAGLGLDVVTLDPSGMGKPDREGLSRLPPGTRVFGVPEPELVFSRVLSLASGTMRRLKGSRQAPGAASAPRATDSAGQASPAETSFSREQILGPGGALGLSRRGYNVWRYYALYQGWADAAGRVGGTLLTDRHEAIISCGPPHPVHEAARRLSRRTGLPLIVDMRDPWSLVERVPAFVACREWYRRAERLEPGVVAAAARVVTATGPAAAALRARYPAAAGRITTILNGCDAEVIRSSAPPARFLIAYAGTVYLDRDPRPVFEAAARVVRELALTPERFGIEFMGNVQAYQGVTLQTIAAQAGIGPFVRTWPSRPRREALEFLAGASILLSLPQDSNLAIPGKLYDYMQFDAWILAMTDPDSATWDLLQGTDSDTVSARDGDGIASIIRQRYLQFTRGERPQALARQTRFTGAYQARLFLEQLAAVTGTPNSSVSA